jgi:hypothetical protein
MSLRATVTFTLVLAFVAAGVTPVAASGRQQADVNGDGACDVLDVQAVTAALLVLTGPRNADVNDDGCVDLLDLQRTVAAASGIPGAQESTSTPSDEIALLVGTVDVTTPNPPVMSILPMAAPVDSVGSAIHANHKFAFSPSPTKERFLLQLTPHAPPLHS